MPASRALTRVTPVAPHPSAVPDETPADRSGLNVRLLVTTADEVVARSRTPALALDMGLEHARGSMVRNNPAEALAILDEVWSGARHTETGWYLRASSLALLGLPAEAARVAADALIRNPHSAANHFLLSLARLSLGELQEARQSIAEASRSRGPDALLLVQSALLEAQLGNVDAAEQLLKRAAAEWPDHPSLPYGRSMIREVLQNAAREKQFGIGSTREENAPWRTPAFARTPVSATAVGTDYDPEPAAQSASDLLDDAVQHLATTLRDATTREIQMVARTMLSSLATGGALANATSPSRAHALRGLISAILSALNVSDKATSVGWAAESENGQWQRTGDTASDDGVVARGTNAAMSDVLMETVRVVLGALRDGRAPEAAQHLRRMRGKVEITSMALLEALVLGTGGASEESGGQSARASATGWDAGGGAVQSGTVHPRLLAPLRLGLALLPESDLLNHSMRPTAVSDRADSYSAALYGSMHGGATEGWLRRRGDVRVLVITMLLFALAALALSFRHPLLALGVAGAGAWLALRGDGGRT